jgi:hypothetical protein
LPTPLGPNTSRAFSLAAIARYRDGRLGCTRHPAGAQSAWWCGASDVGVIIKVARQMGGDVPGAALALGLTATEHHIVVERADAAIERIEAGVADAGRNGDLQFFNSEYRRRRIAAAEQGRGFMSYRVAETRLRRALADAVAAKVTAGGPAGDATPLLARIFGST